MELTSCNRKKNIVVTSRCFSVSAFLQRDKGKVPVPDETLTFRTRHKPKTEIIVVVGKNKQVVRYDTSMNYV